MQNICDLNWSWLRFVVIKKVKKKSTLNESSLQNNVSVYFPLDQAYKESCFRMPICKCSFYTSGQPYAGHLGRGFTRQGHSNLLTIHAEHPKSQHICFPFTPAICPSHTLQLCCVFARETDKGGWQSKWKEEKGKKSERGEKSNYVNVIERRCRSAAHWVTVTGSALPFIHYHTTCERLYILTVKLKHTFTLIMAMTFNYSHPCQALCYADITVKNSAWRIEPQG